MYQIKHFKVLSMFLLLLFTPQTQCTNFKKTNLLNLSQKLLKVKISQSRKNKTSEEHILSSGKRNRVRFTNLPVDTSAVASASLG